jgi:hypothetical protein
MEINNTLQDITIISRKRFLRLEAFLYGMRPDNGGSAGS